MLPEAGEFSRFGCFARCAARAVELFQAWKYWFPLGEPPANGLRTICDVPGEDKPLE